ncbi:glutamine amidotransferase-related protein [Enterobacteriaceae endosymbiont of Plateumaris rustica]|uniref:glutamine amidotransferase-related protein n=1 Tax=Enterobacteriaceae endosymbiont of Plateumaris rustica TaxID=2675796 RepID=UPI001448BD9B|nr:hypothetical protein [Enterobacteriaceae endosymbiont of Plateumaris rustica]QJC29284.1 hypothetical protein GJT82_02330 [Enterobacteriaceae endosymbiont of Plateumaris rustica]
MRLDNQQCQLNELNLLYQFYKFNNIIKRHRHKYKVNNLLIYKLIQHDLLIVIRSKNKLFVEIIKISNYSWFIGYQFHPEFIFNFHNNHLLFIDFIKSSMKKVNLNIK